MNVIHTKYLQFLYLPMLYSLSNLKKKCIIIVKKIYIYVLKKQLLKEQKVIDKKYSIVGC